MSLAHPEKPDERRRRDEWDDFIAELEADLAETVGDLGSLWMPVEIVAPPIAWSELGALDRLVESLRQSGAGGTRSGLLSAYGTQLNPEIASSETGELLATLRAFLLLSDWLREEIGVDLRRRFTPFIDPFPNAYRELVLDPAYAPDRHRLIDDYLAHNPTRNRELDLLPLFAFLEPERVRARLPREKIHARPTFHYRLPDTRLDLPDWSVGLEWERWVTGRAPGRRPGPPGPRHGAVPPPPRPVDPARLAGPVARPGRGGGRRLRRALRAARLRRAAMSRRPLIGVTLSRRGSLGMWLFNAAAVLRAGGWPAPHPARRRPSRWPRWTAWWSAAATTSPRRSTAASWTRRSASTRSATRWSCVRWTSP